MQNRPAEEVVSLPFLRDEEKENNSINNLTLLVNEENENSLNNVSDQKRNDFHYNVKVILPKGINEYESLLHDWVANSVAGSVLYIKNFNKVNFLFFEREWECYIKLQNEGYSSVQYDPNEIKRMLDLKNLEKHPVDASSSIGRNLAEYENIAAMPSLASSLPYYKGLIEEELPTKKPPPPAFSGLPDSKIKLYLWKPNICCEGELGHIALETSKYYFSFWPNSTPGKKTVYTTLGKLNSYAEDSRCKESSEHHWLILNVLHSKRANWKINLFNAYVENGQAKWSLVAATLFEKFAVNSTPVAMLNCSQAVLDILTSAGVELSLISNNGKIFNRLFEETSHLMAMTLPACNALFIEPKMISSYVLNSSGSGILLYLIHELFKKKSKMLEVSNYFNLPIKFIMAASIFGVNLIYAYAISDEISISDIYGKRVVDFICMSAISYIGGHLLLKPFFWCYLNSQGYGEFISPKYLFHACTAHLGKQYIFKPENEKFKYSFNENNYFRCGVVGFLLSVGFSTFLNRNLNSFICPLLPAFLITMGYYKYCAPIAEDRYYRLINQVLDLTVSPRLEQLKTPNVECDQETQIEIEAPTEVCYWESPSLFLSANIGIALAASILGTENMDLTASPKLILFILAAAVAFLLGTLVFRIKRCSENIPDNVEPAAKAPCLNKSSTANDSAIRTPLISSGLYAVPRYDCNNALLHISQEDTELSHLNRVK